MFEGVLQRQVKGSVRLYLSTLIKDCGSVNAEPTTLSSLQWLFNAHMLHKVRATNKHH